MPYLTSNNPSITRVAAFTQAFDRLVNRFRDIPPGLLLACMRSVDLTRNFQVPDHI